MKRTGLKTIVAGIFGLSAFSGTGFSKSSAADVWNVVKTEGVYGEELPRYAVTLGSFYGYFVDKLQKASERTLNNSEDILPKFKKLLHPNGVCLKGTWEIEEETGFTGYFKKDAKGILILRASTALTEILRGERRAFGLAGKLYPTLDENEVTPTAPFFVIDNLAGTYAESLLDSPLTNDITNIDFGPDVFGKTPILLAAAKALTLAERTVGALPSVRQLYPISELGQEGGAITPRFMRITGVPGFRSKEQDFRKALMEETLEGAVRFNIELSSSKTPGLPKEWTKVGSIVMDEAVASEGCDSRLHFPHPKWRKDLVH